MTIQDTADLAHLLTIIQAARHAKVTRQGIYDAIRRGKLKVTIIAGHKYVSHYNLQIWQNNRKKGFIA